MRVAAFAALWALAIAGLVFLLTVGRGQALTDRSLLVVATFATGSFAGYLLAHGVGAFVTRDQSRPSARFAAMFLCLALGTAGMTTLLFFIHLFLYYSQWHESRFSLGRIVEILYTGAFAGYIFGVQGARLLLPFALPLLFLVAYLFAKRKI